MAQTAVFYGASDDLVEVEGIKGADEFSALGGEPASRSFVISGSGGQLRVIVTYAMGRRSGTWSVAIDLVDEDVPLPDWPMRFSTHERGYSVRLEIDCPDDAVLIKEGKETP